MTPAQYRTALARLGLTQAGAAKLFGVSLRTAAGYAAPIGQGHIVIRPGFAKLLRLMIKYDLTPNDVK